ncbi:MAG: fluoride efflux transporter CrcB [Burkholderiaceae bacterium]|nr:fluoride efflux transporter CrcB [Burkholderiaceae bacterium]
MIPPHFSLAGFLAVGVGAVLGAWLRWAAGIWLNTVHRALPLGTLLVNVVGGLLIGLAVAWFSRNPDFAPEWRLFAITGFLGALTTFSSFSIESYGLLARGAFGWALAHTALHVFGALAAAAIGYRLAVA